jgi:ubiquinone biosynthesis protein
MADINIGQMVMEVVEMLNRYGVSVPASLTMLGRSLLVVQGMLAGVSPDTNVMGIVADYVAASAAGKRQPEKRPKAS